MTVANSNDVLQRRVISLVLASEDDLLKGTESAEFLFPLPGKILPSDPTNWSVAINSLVIGAIKPETFGKDCVTLLLLSRVLAREQAVGPRLLPVLGIFHYHKSRPPIFPDLSKINLFNLIPITELPDNCNNNTVVDLAICDIRGNRLAAENFNKKGGFACSILLSRRS